MLKDSGIEPEGIETEQDRSPESVLIDLGARMCASPSRIVRIAPRELDRWPEEAVTALKAQKILRKAGPARGAACPGCERQCPMPLHGLGGSSDRPGSGRKPSSPFIVCDKRGDTHRVPVPADSLAQWEMSADMLGRFVAGRLSLRWKGRKPEGRDVLEVGIAGKGKQRRMLSLRMEGRLRLVAGSSELDLSSRVIRTPSHGPRDYPPRT